MRLTLEEVTAIKAAAAEAFGPGAVVRLFGSRVHDHLRGGDTDLHIEVEEGRQDVSSAGAFKWKLFELIDKRKVDLVLHARGRALRAIDRIALDEGIVL